MNSFDILKKSFVILSKQFGEETLLYDTRQKEFYRLNNSATKLWNLIDGKTMVKDILQQLEQDKAEDYLELIVYFKKQKFIP